MPSISSKAPSGEDQAMADFVLRGIDRDLKDQLRARAARNRRSMDAELLELLRAAMNQPQPSPRAELKKLAADIRAPSASRMQTPSDDLLREACDER